MAESNKEVDLIAQPDEDATSHMLIFDRNGPFKRKRVRRRVTTKPGHALLSIQYCGS
jgi:hypothetical protein